tara:strand:- start:1834 stop:1950 length:117 start_codon:yes stop_codon:yes gene_type:complete
MLTPAAITWLERDEPIVGQARAAFGADLTRGFMETGLH